LRDLGLTVLWLVCCASTTHAAQQAAVEPAPATLTIARAGAPIRIDGDLSDEGWRAAIPIETWYEVNPGDNTPPKVKNIGRVAYDDRYFYVGLEFDDPHPEKIRSPLGDRDNLSSATDYGGVILDTRNTGRTAILFLANARGLQYDAVSDDGGGGEDSSPDFYWDSAGRITATGWTLEIRIPFTSLRYPKTDPQTWGIMLYRNHPRDFRYQFFTLRLPRGSSCFICHSNKLVGLRQLPAGGHMVAAPYVSARQASEAQGGAGAPLHQGPVQGDLGLDFKWMPTAGLAIDAMINPDFSQVESDVSQISANERFALLYPEKRPFFLEGLELFSTPIRAVHTRSITSPRFGVRATGKWGATAFTGLVTDDRGGGRVILPGASSSDFADQDFHSSVFLGRARRDFGASFVSWLVSAREQEQGAFNRVVGPDFQWRPNARDMITGQVLYSFTKTPQRTDLADAWDGRSFEGHAAQVWASHNTQRFDAYAQYDDLGDGFRADNGFVPQVGYRQGSFEMGYTVRPKSGWIRRFRTYLIADREADREGALLSEKLSPGFGFDARWNSQVRIRYLWHRVRSGDDKHTLPGERLVFSINSSPTRFLSHVGLDGYVGHDIDLDGARRGWGGDVTIGSTLRLSNHLDVNMNGSRRWLDVDGPSGVPARLFTARVERMRINYSFTSRVFARVIAQYVSTRRDPSLYADEVERHESIFTGSALLAYKLNWQTVLYAGYGDARENDEREHLQPTGRQFFVKLSYAWQR
jgi:hypothetical protein